MCRPPLRLNPIYPGDPTCAPCHLCWPCPLVCLASELALQLPACLLHNLRPSARPIRFTNCACSPSSPAATLHHLQQPFHHLQQPLPTTCACPHVSLPHASNNAPLFSSPLPLHCPDALPLNCPIHSLTLPCLCACLGGSGTICFAFMRQLPLRTITPALPLSACVVAFH